MKKPLMLMILDGYGMNPLEYGNAIKKASTPNLDKLFKSCPSTTLGASGMDVGLPQGQMGNSEVGHTNIGAGRVVYQELTRITKSIADGDFSKNKVLLAGMENCKQKGTSLHLMGLLSDGGVHSHNTHLYALLQLAKQQGVQNVYIHCFTDGRDVPPTSGRDFIKELEQQCRTIGVGKIATVMGRYYAMDRDNRWERVVQAYDAMVNRKGIDVEEIDKAVAESYAQGVTDEFLKPMICAGGAGIQDGDTVICYNFRPDRAREITRTLVDEAFEGFHREGGKKQVYYICMTQYDAQMPGVQVAFTPQSLEDTFGAYLAKKGLTQLRIAETEKYAHVTFFFGGGVEQPYEGEDRAMIPSPKVATYDLQPQMSANGVTDEVIKRIESGKYDVIILNFANCDMVGHTGVFAAAVKAVEAVDGCVGRVAEAMEEQKGILLLTADHGNADQMYEPDGSSFTAHTTNPVPFVVMGYPCKLRQGGRLADIAPTMLEILNLPKPAAMDGVSLIEK